MKFLSKEQVPRLVTLGVILLILCGTIVSIWLTIDEKEKRTLIQILNTHPALIVTAAFLFPVAVIVAVNWVFRHYIEPLRKMVEEVKLFDLVNSSHRLTPSGNHDLVELARAINSIADKVQGIRESTESAVRVANEENQREKADVDETSERVVVQQLGSIGASYLAELMFTAFDCETSGLDPSAGDAIISIGAVRIVNRKILRQETFDQLVDPRIALRAESMRIHGIDEAMLRGQPTIDVVLPKFERFIEGSVLVGHNAAFDMRFLQMKAQSGGVQFDGPVLDTLLLSAAVHPYQEDHSLEALAKRAGVTVVGRHTALGDALLTGEVFVKLLPLLAEKGIHTLNDALTASKKTYFARIKY